MAANMTVKKGNGEGFEKTLGKVYKGSDKSDVNMFFPLNHI